MTESQSPRPALLLVDDDRRNLLAISELLSDLDTDIVCATSGREALRLILKRDFCAILMDVRMPDMDGYETAEIIRQRERSRRVPLIFLTAYDKDDTHIFRGYSTGAVDYVFKPVEPVVLRAKVSVFIELFRQADAIRRKGEQERLLLEENLRIRSEHLEAEQRLRANEQREAMIFRSLPIAVYEGEFENEGRIRRFLHDDGVQRLLGYEAADFATRPNLWVERVHPDDWGGVRDALKRMESGQSYSVEYRWRCADDRYRYFLDQGIVAQTGDQKHVFGTLFDVHDRRILEQQLVHAQKIDAVGKLTGGIVHDFNNMLTVVIGNLDRMQRNGGLDQRTARRVDHALQGALHCRDVTRRLLGFTRQQSCAPQAIDLNEHIHSLADLLKRTLGERIEIKTHMSADLSHVFIDASQVEAAILNLLVNARDAMPGGGRVSIRTGNVDVDVGEDPPVQALAPGKYVMLDVTDSGMGMPAEVLQRACEPFFTTKEAGKGTGLGLSTIQGFVRQSGGELEIESTEGAGTTVRIYLPYHDGRSDADYGQGDAEQISLPRAQDGDVVLVVEDEDEVRRTTVNTLRELGYRVIEAGTADSALRTLEQVTDVRLLFTDVIMPGSSNGLELAREAQSRWPDLRVLFTSAYGGDVVEESSENGLEPFLLKPFRDFELARAVRRAITSVAAG